MSRTLRCRGLHVWKYPKKEKGFAGYHFYLSAEDAMELLGTFRNFQKTRAASERLILQLTPVTKKVLRMVNARSSAEKSFRKLILSFDESEEFLENRETLEMKLHDVDFSLFLEALEATQNGVGDFNILDASAWFWPALS